MASSLNKNLINERRVQMRHTPKSFQPPLDHALANPKPLLNWTAVMLANGTIDRLVRNNEVTPPMASSLINDSAATTSIIKHLIEGWDRLIVAEGEYDIQSEKQKE